MKLEVELSSTLGGVFEPGGAGLHLSTVQKYNCSIVPIKTYQHYQCHEFLYLYRSYRGIHQAGTIIYL